MITLYAHTPTGCLRQCSGYMHPRTSGNCHHKSSSFWKASDSPASLHRCPNMSNGQFHSHSCIPSSCSDRRIHLPIRRRLIRACRRLHSHSTMALLREPASNSRQYQSSLERNCEPRLLHPSLGRLRQSFVQVYCSRAHRFGNVRSFDRARPPR